MRFTSIDTVSNLNNKNILMIQPNGKLTQVEKQEFALKMLDFMYVDKFCGNSTDIIASPTWANGPNKLYTSCPQVNVGIGTNTPAYKLQVVGTTNSTNFTGIKYDGQEAAFNFSSINFGAFNQKLTVGSAVSSNQFGKLFVKTDQNAGIHLDLIGASNYTKVLYAELTNPTTEIIKVQNTALNYTPFLLESSGKMVIHNGTDKIFQLNPNGLLRAREIKVDLATWPDYVFQPSYNLMPLKDLKIYLDANKHLPNVPNAKTIETEGVNLGEMSKISMEKIEELTLYLLQQQEMFEIQSKLLEEQAQKIKALEEKFKSKN